MRWRWLILPSLILLVVAGGFLGLLFWPESEPTAQSLPVRATPAALPAPTPFCDGLREDLYRQQRRGQITTSRVRAYMLAYGCAPPQP